MHYSGDTDTDSMNTFCHSIWFLEYQAGNALVADALASVTPLSAPYTEWRRK